MSTRAVQARESCVACASRALGVQPDDAFIHGRLCALPEARVLDYFWRMADGGADRLWLLVHVGHVVIERPPTWSPTAVRESHEQQRGSGAVSCFGCLNGARKLYRHHVIEVHHGGSNAPRNQVPLCFNCHVFLHPWLTEEAPPRAESGFSGMIEVMKSLTKRSSTLDLWPEYSVTYEARAREREEADE